jgi:hypothetical protein
LEFLIDEEALAVKQETVVRSFKKREICNARDDTEDRVLFDKSGSSYNNNDECGNSDEDVRGFCD